MRRRARSLRRPGAFSGVVGALGPHARRQPSEGVGALGPNARRQPSEGVGALGPNARPRRSEGVGALGPNARPRRSEGALASSARPRRSACPWAARHVAFALALPALLALGPPRAQAQRRVTPSHLWNEPEAPTDLMPSRVDRRGLGRPGVSGILRPGFEAPEVGLETHPWRTNDGSAEAAGDAADAQERDRLRIFAEEELRLGLSNLSEEALLDAYPATLPEELIGARGGVRNLLRLELEGPLRDDLHFALGVVDDRTWRETPLGSPVDVTRTRPRYAAGLRWRVSERLELRAGGRYEAHHVDNFGVGAWTLPSAAARLRRDVGFGYVGLRAQPHRRHEVTFTYGFEGERDDMRSLGGVGVPGHNNIDSFQRWGNAAWTSRRRQRHHHLDLRWRLFAGGLARASAHTLTLGIQADTWGRHDDETRNGGHTFIDGLPAGANRLLDESDRSTWELFLSDRGDELHGASRTTTVAAYLEDHVAIHDRVDLFAGVRVEGTHLAAESQSLLTTTTASPRAELWWTASPDRFTRFFAQYGRLHPRIDPRVGLRDPRAAAFSPLEYWRWTGDPMAEPLPSANDARWIRDEAFGNVVGRIGPDVEHPYVDRLAIGGQTRIVPAELSLRAQWIHERHRRPLALYDRGYDADPSRYVLEEDRFGPGDRDVVRFLSLADGGSPDYVVGNAPGGFRDVHRFEVRGRFEPKRWLRFDARYLFTIDRGNLDMVGPLALGWRDASNRAPSVGPTPEVDRHRVDLSLGLLGRLVSLYVDYALRAGARYSRVALVRPTGQQRVFVYDAAGRGAYIYPSVHRLDVRLQVQPRWRHGRWRIFFEARNVTNAAAVTAFREVSAAFRSVARLQDPLELRIGVSHAH